MIAIQPLIYTDFVDALGLPGFLSKRVTKKNVERTGIDLEQTTFMDNVKDITVPTRLIQNANDEYLNKSTIDKYYDSLSVEKDMMWLDLDKKRAAGYDYLTKNPEKVLNWFNKHMD